MSEDEVQSIKEEIAVLKERVGNWMNTTSDYRISLCNKLDVISKQLDQRPCAVHEQKLKSIGTIWGIIWFVIPALLTLAVVWGSMQTTMQRHEIRLGILEELHPRHEVGNGKMQT